jgi:hypothetical protein
MSRPLGREPRRARRRRQVSWPRFRRSVVPAVTLRGWPRLQDQAVARPPCLASSRRAKMPGKGYACGWNNGTLNSPLIYRRNTASLAHPPGTTVPVCYKPGL